MFGDIGKIDKNKSRIFITLILPYINFLSRCYLISSFQALSLKQYDFGRNRQLEIMI